MLECTEPAIPWHRFKASTSSVTDHHSGATYSVKSPASHSDPWSRTTRKGSWSCSAIRGMFHRRTIRLSSSPLVFQAAFVSTDMQHAMALTCAYEWRPSVADGRFSRPTARVPAPSPQPIVVPGSATPPAAPCNASPPTFKHMSPTKMEERRRQGLCFNCDVPFVRGHHCQRLFYLEVEDSDDNVNATETPADTDIDALVISLLAMTRLRMARTMHVPVTLNSRRLVALLDTDSTHNFLNSSIAEELRLLFSTCPGLHVSVANSDQVPCRRRADHVAMTVVSGPFAVHSYPISLGSFDIVLGVVFLGTLGPVLWDFDQLCLSFRRDGRHGIGCSPSPTPALRVVSVTAQLLLEDLLAAFTNVFAEPTGLPPPRACDHRNHLRPRTLLVAIRPYRYAQLQKDELEHQVATMLTSSMICPSTSALSAPVLLVKKQDASWHFYIDYRALNEHTVKDRFPIPVVDELLDHGARFFTKLDLRSGYHQVRMREEDIEKTAFRTHHGQFEFLVMPFGLTNAPATFQSLMNDVLHPFPHRFILLFFDDILIYSNSWLAHLQHIKTVLEGIHDHSLFVKWSKCSFGTSSVAYLVHVISATGVATDTDKVDAVTSWPQL
ncbi:hypothetical protein U9M48_039163 [Paspalum notatum var. saurae]|uniref:Reverse transcriptase domain-containing protein n=1 Tax=Paspalum notatum var. saurae TaxID=547442 RepID=A0AAQ3UPP5_PASNO